MYLIDETHPLNFSDLVSGKRLFRMTASEFANDSEENTDLADADELTSPSLENESNLLLLKKIIEIMEYSNVDARMTVAKINDTVKEYYKSRRN